MPHTKDRQNGFGLLTSMYQILKRWTGRSFASLMRMQAYTVTAQTIRVTLQDGLTGDAHSPMRMHACKERLATWLSSAILHAIWYKSKIWPSYQDLPFLCKNKLHSLHVWILKGSACDLVDVIPIVNGGTYIETVTDSNSYVESKAWKEQCIIRSRTLHSYTKRATCNLVVVSSILCGVWHVWVLITLVDLLGHQVSIVWPYKMTWNASTMQ